MRRDDRALLKARSGDEALELLLHHDVALALVDVQMPGLDGFELAELMRGNERTRRIPIIFVTAGSADGRRRFRGYETGAVDFIQKPIEADVLRSKVDVFCELDRQRQQIMAQRDELEVQAEALREAGRRKDEFLLLLLPRSYAPQGREGTAGRFDPRDQSSHQEPVLPDVGTDFPQREGRPHGRGAGLRFEVEAASAGRRASTHPTRSEPGRPLGSQLHYGKSASDGDIGSARIREWSADRHSRHGCPYLHEGPDVARPIASRTGDELREVRSALRGGRQLDDRRFFDGPGASHPTGKKRGFAPPRRRSIAKVSAQPSRRRSCGASTGRSRSVGRTTA